MERVIIGKSKNLEKLKLTSSAHPSVKNHPQSSLGGSFLCAKYIILGCIDSE